MRRCGVLGEPAVERVAELEDGEEQWQEHDDHERRLERRRACFRREAPQRTDCIWTTSAWSLATRPLFQAEIPTTRVPRTTAAPTMYSIVASPTSSAVMRARIISTSSYRGERVGTRLRLLGQSEPPGVMEDTQLVAAHVAADRDVGLLSERDGELSGAGARYGDAHAD